MHSITRPLIGFPGGKSTVSEKIIKEFPKEYNKFCEVFAGGASVYWKENKAKERVINDKTKEVMDFYKKFKDTSCEVVRNCDMDLSMEERKNACNNREKSVCQYLQGNKFAFNGLCSQGLSHKDRAMSNVKRDCEKYKEKLQHTKILNQDWQTIANKCDKKDSVIFLDPPYVKKSFKYPHEGVTPQEVCDFARKSKAKVVITYDNDPSVRKACKGLHIKKLPIKYSMTTGTLGKAKKVNELLIKNY